MRGVNLLHAAFLEQLQAARDGEDAAAAHGNPVAGSSVTATDGTASMGVPDAMVASERQTPARLEARSCTASAAADVADSGPAAAVRPSKRRRRSGGVAAAADHPVHTAATAATHSVAEPVSADATAAADKAEAAGNGSRKRKKAESEALKPRPIDFDPLKVKQPERASIMYAATYPLAQHNMPGTLRQGRGLHPKATSAHALANLPEPVAMNESKPDQCRRRSGTLTLMFTASMSRRCWRRWRLLGRRCRPSSTRCLVRCGPSNLQCWCLHLEDDAEVRCALSSVTCGVAAARLAWAPQHTHVMAASSQFSLESTPLSVIQNT